MRLILIVVGALWGAWSGLLLPRAAHRLSVEAEEPWQGHCPDGHPIKGPFDGWLGRARCEGSGDIDISTYGPSTPAVSTVTALVCAALAAATGPHPELAVWLLAAPVAVLLALVDYRVHRLPDVLTLPLAAATLALLGVAALLPADAGSWLTALLGGLALGAGYLVLYLINPAGMGFGDVKLALALGTALGWYGWPVFVTGAFAGVLYGALYGLGMVALRRAGRRTAIPLGPFMLGGAFTGVVLGALAAA
ncbi:leader peptidase (prepilin peptidase) / N-methyltransferase [Streptomyces sp. 3213]|uniref:prepilin peptidase n=1 Tax=Streptomyces sp. 3213.3 TaxID=1855348 RepID=UPI00089C47DC|nr:prepilin peptidase [Streptomyces sp. 3213.3]SEE40033.1 leader peptidase (prepilin peptidase) / N-methyltransferase [Streptomyces sp. 3213] [Streptomyces sp. 3213.3]